MSDVPAAPSSPCEVEPLLRQVLRVASPLLSPPIGKPTSSSTGQPQTPGKTPKIPVNKMRQKKDSGKNEGAALSALMVTLGPHGFMIVRRCEEGMEDSPLLPRPAPPTTSDSDDMEGASCQEGTYHSLDRVVGLHFPPPDYDQIVSVSGAGDCLASGFVTGMLAALRVSECAAVGNTAARLSLQALPTVPPTLSTLRASKGGASLLYKLIC